LAAQYPAGSLPHLSDANFMVNTGLLFVLLCKKA
jgi:hypothetical protein